MALTLSHYDFLFCGIVVFSAIIAIFRGGVAELLSLSTWFISIFVMRHYALYIDKIIPSMVSNTLLRSLISYVVAFIAVAIIMTLIKAIIQRFIKQMGLSGLNYAIGALFGIIRGVIVSALIIILIEIIGIDHKQEWRNSLLSPILIPTVNFMVNAVPERLKNIGQAPNFKLTKNYLIEQSTESKVKISQ